MQFEVARTRSACRALRANPLCHEDIGPAESVDADDVVPDTEVELERMRSAVANRPELLEHVRIKIHAAQRAAEASPVAHQPCGAAAARSTVEPRQLELR